MNIHQEDFLSLSKVQRLLASRYALYIVLALLPGLFFGCYGEFPVTKSLYQFNGDVSEESFVQSAVLWVLGFFFIYSIAMLADLVIFNLVEFWTGENPMSAQVYESPDGSRVVMTPSEDGREVRLELSKDGEDLGRRRIVRKEEGLFDIYDSKDALVGRVRRTENGDLLLRRTGEERTTVLTRESLRDFTRQLAFAR